MGTKREAKPPPSEAPRPVERQALDAALKLFVAAFVVEDKRSQLHKRLLTAERRGETLEALPRWLEGAAPLDGADRSPAGLRARLGELVGIRIAEDGASRTTIAHALELGRGTASLFIADSGHLAMITAAGEPPLLCARFDPGGVTTRGAGASGGRGGGR